MASVICGVGGWFCFDRPLLFVTKKNGPSFLFATKRKTICHESTLWNPTRKETSPTRFSRAKRAMFRCSRHQIIPSPLVHISPLQVYALSALYAFLAHYAALFAFSPLLPVSLAFSSISPLHPLRSLRSPLSPRSSVDVSVLMLPLSLFSSTRQARSHVREEVENDRALAGAVVLYGL
jgi:hypothetical protein